MNWAQNLYKKQAAWLLKEKYEGHLSAEAKADIEKLRQGEPLDYLIGFTYFLGSRIDLGKRPLIPRPETEFWTEKAIAEIRKDKRKAECLDLFSGSGAIGIAVLKHIPGASVDLGEINKDFIQQIKFNLRANKIAEKRAAVIQTDIFQNIKKKYDCIFANPPYIAEKRRRRVQKPVLDYEPKSALFGGRDGLLYIRKFLKQAKKYLKPEGKIYLEFDSFQKPKISALLKREGYKNFQFFKDQYNHWRYVKIDVS